MNKVEYYLSLAKTTENFHNLNFQYDFDDLKIKKVHFKDSNKIEFQIFRRMYRHKYDFLPVPNIFLPLEKTDEFVNLIIRKPIEGSILQKIENVFFENEDEAREFVFRLSKNKQKTQEEWVKI